MATRIVTSEVTGPVNWSAGMLYSGASSRMMT
jgi:hypothetical protein